MQEAVGVVERRSGFLSYVDKGVNPKKLGVYFVGDGEALKGLSFYWSTASLASWLSPSFVLELWPAFSRGGPSPPSWPGGGLPPAQSCLPRKGERLERPVLFLPSGDTQDPHSPFDKEVGILVYVICTLHLLYSKSGLHTCPMWVTLLETQNLTTSQTFEIRVCILTRPPGEVYT